MYLVAKYVERSVHSVVAYTSGEHLYSGMYVYFTITLSNVIIINLIHDPLVYLLMMATCISRDISEYLSCIYFFIWRDSPQLARVFSFTTFLDHTQRRTTVGRTPLNE
jgi:hypothetical protein